MKLIRKGVLEKALKDTDKIVDCEKKHKKHEPGKLLRSWEDVIGIDGKVIPDFVGFDQYRCRWCPLILPVKRTQKGGKNDRTSKKMGREER